MSNNMATSTTTVTMPKRTRRATRAKNDEDDRTAPPPAASRNSRKPLRSSRRKKNSSKGDKNKNAKPVVSIASEKQSGKSADATGFEWMCEDDDAHKTKTTAASKASNKKLSKRRPMTQKVPLPSSSSNITPKTNKPISKTRTRRSRSKERKSAQQQMVDFIEEEQKQNNKEDNNATMKTVNGRLLPVEILVANKKRNSSSSAGHDSVPKQNGSKMMSSSNGKSSSASTTKMSLRPGSRKRMRNDERVVVDCITATLSADTSRDGCCEGVASDSGGRKKRASTAASPFEKRKKKRRIGPGTMAKTFESTASSASSKGGGSVTSSRLSNHSRTAEETNGMPTSKKERWNNPRKTVFDVSDVSSTASAKQRRMDRPKADGRTHLGTLWEDESYRNEEHGNNSDAGDDPSSDDWIGEMTTFTAISMERMAAVTKRKFDRQRRYYESQLQIQREENRERDDENARLRKELSETNKMLNDFLGGGSMMPVRCSRMIC